MFIHRKTEETREEACVNGLASLAHKDIRFEKPKFTNGDFDPNEPEGLFHLFDRLNEAFFGGALKRGENVSLTWADGDPGTDKQTFGFTTAKGAVSENGIESSMIKITLNRDLCSLDTEDREGKALAALIHQMGHAYFMLCKGAKYSDNIHDECFKALMLKISDIWGGANQDEVAAFIILSVGPKVKLAAGNPIDHCAWIYHPDIRPVFPRRVIMWHEVSHLYKRATDLADEMGDFMEGDEEDQKKKKSGKRRSQIREFFSL